MEESEVIGRVLAGDIDSFRALVIAYEKRLRSYCLNRLPASETEDAMQDIFIKAFRSLRTFDRSKPFAAWFFAVARSSISARKLRFRRDKSKENRLRLYSTEADNGNEGQSNLEAEMARRAVAKLSGRLREVVELHYFAGLSVRETAIALSIGESAVKQRLFRARKELVRFMEGTR